MAIALSNRLSLLVDPPVDFHQLMKDTYMNDRILPKGLDNIWNAMCGSCAVETAFKSAFIAYQTRARGDRAPTQEEFESAMNNQQPGSPDLSILSFNGAFHGK